MTQGRKAPAGRAIRCLPFPENFVGPVAGTMLLLLAWAGVAHASGSGWVQAVGALVAGLLLLGLSAPALFAARLNVMCSASPSDASAGSPVRLELIANRAMRCTPVAPGAASVLLERNVPSALVIEPDHRGVIAAVTVRLGTAAPLGLLWWSRYRHVVLPHPMCVAPRLGEARAGLLEAPATESGRTRARPAPTGDLRGVRPYQDGDGRRRIHWRASAHTGELMVRESEQAEDQPRRVVVELPADREAAERLAEEALGTVVAALNAGSRVVLETHEAGGRLTAAVSDRLSAGRRLARAESPSRAG